MTYSWEILFTQWVVWDNVTQNLSANLQEKPTDPLYETEYIYSTTNNRKEYELLAIYEWESWLNTIQTTHATTTNKIKVSGNYNWVYSRTTNYIIPIPSIITSETLPIELKSNTSAINSMVITNGKNIPNLNIPWFETKTWWLVLNLTPVKNINNSSLNSDKIAIVDAIQSTYSWTFLENTELIRNILSKTTDVEKLEYINSSWLNTQWGSSWNSNEEEAYNPIWDYTVFYLNWNWDEVNTDRVVSYWSVWYVEWTWYSLWWSQSITTPDTAEWDFPWDFTIDARVKFNYIDSWYTRIITSSAWHEWLFATALWKLALYDWFSYRSWSTTLNTWERYHIAVARKWSGTDNCKIFVNWVVDWTFTNEITISWKSTLMIWAYDVNATSRWLKWDISHIRITNWKGLWDSNFTPPPRD
jgi:hypothetical protein